MRVGIVGGGLAGCAAAFVLKKAGHEPVIYESGDTLAAGASGNQIGLYNPRFGAEWTAQSQYYASAFERALEVFNALDDIAYNPCGALHLITDEKKQRRYSKMIENWGCEIDMRIVGAVEASDIAGVEIEQDALFLSQSGSVCPALLCAAYASGVEVHLNSTIDDWREVDADIVIFSAGPALRHFNETKHIDFRAVRGQVTLIEAVAQLKTNICYGGYVSAAVGGVHMVGSTFQRWLDHSDILSEDDADNLVKLSEAIPAFPEAVKVVGHRASVRTTSRDHFPVVGALSDRLYVSSAHGSHGILSTLMTAEILAEMIEGNVGCVSADVISALSPMRFRD